MKVTIGTPEQGHNVILSLCDYSGNWPRPFNEDHGYSIIQMDLKHGDDLLDPIRTKLGIDEALYAISKSLGIVRNPHTRIVGILMAPPCTDFSVSGAQYWPAKDANGTTAIAVDIVRACLALKALYSPAWWVLENPVGRLPRCVPELGKPSMYFHPCDYAGWGRTDEEVVANRYTKKTGLWGSFKAPMESGLDPIRYCAQGSWLQKLGGKSERTKELRSMTPSAFARAFAAAQVA
jgi:hypothetical protein